MKRYRWKLVLILLFLLESTLYANPIGSYWSLLDSSGPSRRGHKCAYDSQRDVIVLFGGMDSMSIYDSCVWEWSYFWTRIDTPGPGPRIGHGLCYDTLNHASLLFGGRSPDGQYLNDTWTWDGTAWTQTQTEGPSPRGFFTFAYDSVRQRAVLFGGCDLNTIFGETWEWDGSNWTLAHTDGPPPRMLSAMAYDDGNSQMVLFGGRPAIDEGFLNDTWVYGETGWINIPYELFPPPPARAGHAMAYNSSYGGMILFGGFGEESNLPFDDTWSWSGSDWFPRYTSDINPNPRYSADMITVISKDLMLLIGGGDSCRTYADIWEFPYNMGLYVVGDTNDNGVFNGLDVTYSVNFFKGMGLAPRYIMENCPNLPLFVAGDVNSSCTFNGIDVTYCVNYLKGTGRWLMPCSYCPPLRW